MGKTRNKVKNKRADDTKWKEQGQMQSLRKKRKSSEVREDSSVVPKRQSLQKLEKDESPQDSIIEKDQESISGTEVDTNTEQCDLKDRIMTHVTPADDAVVILMDDEELVLQGAADMRVLCGSVEILGYTLHKSEQFTRIFSPSSNGLLTLMNVNSVSNSSKVKELPDLDFVSETSNKKTILKMYNKCQVSSMVHIKQFKSVMLNFVTNYTPFQSLLRHTSKTDSDLHVIEGTGLTIVTDRRVNKFTVSEDYWFVKESLLKCLHEGSKAPVIAICGGKNVGKSTLCRYLTNTLLNHVGEVAFLECDVGQTEFTLSGCVSLTVVKQPLLGPPFTHITQPQVCTYYGRLSPADDPTTYMECVQQLYQHYTTELSHLPLIVNTMGWNKGLGIHLLIDSLRTVRPDIVIQIDVSRQAHNLPSMRPEFVATNPGWVTAMVSPDEACVDYQFAIITSPVTKPQEHREHLKAPDHRSLSLLAYFGPVSVQRSLTASRPYRVPWSSVAVYVSHTVVPQTQLLYSLNASVVALYKAPEDIICKSDVADYPCLLTQQPRTGYLGFGIVRGIDPVEKVFYILTPVFKHQLKRVNALVRGALEVPPQLLLKQKSGGDLPPYVDYTKDGVGGGGVKSRRPMVRHFKAIPERHQD